MFLSENNYQLPRRAQTWSGWSALSQKLNHTAVNAVGSCYWIFAHVCVRVASRLGTLFHSQGVYIYPWECGVRGLSVGVTIKEPLLNVQKRLNLLCHTS